MTTFSGYSATVKALSNGELRALPVQRHAALFRVLEGDERARLRASIRTGYDDAHPIVVWHETGEIVDGRNRRDLAVELNRRDVPVAFVEFPDETAVTTYVVAQNLARRHLTTKERAELAARLVVNGGMSTRLAANATGVSQMTAQRAAAKSRAGETSDSPGRSRTTGADGKSYPAARAKRASKPPKPDPRIARVRKALDVLSRMAGETIPAEIEHELSDDERAALVAVLDALAKTSLRSSERSGRDGSTKLDLVVVESSAA